MIKSWKNKNLNNINNKHIVITGTTSGLGLEALKHLCSCNASVVVGVRNTKKADKQAAEILKNFPSAKIKVFPLDLSNINSVVEFAKSTLDYFNFQIDVLINNAGMFARPKEVLENGFEKHFFTNTIAPIFLSKLLLPAMEKTTGSKIIFVSSISLNNSQINFDDIDFKNETDHVRIYANTKRWLTFYTIKLSKVLKEKNSNTSVVLCHPGISGTSLMRPENGTFSKFTYKICDIGQKILFPSPKKASLAELAGITAKTEDFQWISPSIFNIWGYPKAKKLKIKKFKPEQIDLCYQKIEEILSKIPNVKN